jgi:hypothetical protein
MISSRAVAESLWVRGNPEITHLSVNQPLFLYQPTVRRTAKCGSFLATDAADNDYKESEVSSIPAQNQHLILSTLDMSNRCRY